MRKSRKNCAVYEGRINYKTDYYNREWLSLRYDVLNFYGPKCMLCGVTSKDAIINVDHIKPRSKYPSLELCFSNLQVLCESCNIGKCNRTCDDFRPIKFQEKNNIINKELSDKLAKLPEEKKVILKKRNIN